MKNTLKPCAAACGLFVSVIAASAAPVVETADFALRQLWPWSGQIVAEFTVSGSVTAPGATATLAAYDGETFLCDIPLSAATGDTVISSVGHKRIKIDPTKVPGLAGRGTLKDFRLGIAYADATLDFNSAGVLYVVFDLTKARGEAGFVTALTERDLTGGSTAREGVGPYGAWKRQYWGSVSTRSRGSALRKTRRARRRSSSFATSPRRRLRWVRPRRSRDGSRTKTTTVTQTRRPPMALKTSTLSRCRATTSASSS